MKTKEWWVILTLLGFLFCILIYDRVSSERSMQSLAQVKKKAYQPIEIVIQGAVKDPGIYLCTPGSTLEDLIKKVGLTQGADKRRIPLKKVLLASQTISIPSKKEIEERGKKISLEEK